MGIDFETIYVIISVYCIFTFCEVINPTVIFLSTVKCQPAYQRRKQQRGNFQTL